MESAPRYYGARYQAVGRRVAECDAKDPQAAYLPGAKERLSFDSGNDIQHSKDFYNLLLKSSQRQGFPVRSFDYFLQIQQNLLAGGNGLVFLARSEHVQRPKLRGWVV